MSSDVKRNDSPFEPWNGGINRDSPNAPWNDPMKRDSPFAVWNNPLEAGLYRDEVERWR